MVVIRCTHRLQLRLHAGIKDPVPESTTALGDWCGTVLQVGRRRLLLFVSDRSRLPLLLPVRDADHLRTALPKALSELLVALGVAPTAVAREREQMAEMCLAPSNSRSLLGTLSDFGCLTRAALITRPEPALLPLSVELAETPVSPLQYEHPSAVALRLLSEKWRGAVDGC